MATPEVVAPKKKGNIPLLLIAVVVGAVLVICVCCIGLGVLSALSTGGGKDIPALPEYTLKGSQGDFHFVLLNANTDYSRGELRKISENICGDKDFCKVIFWKDNRLVADSLPMTDAQVNAWVAMYNRNKSTGLDEMLLCNPASCD